MKSKTKIALVLVVFLIGAFLRFYRLAEIPPGLYPDEAVNGNNAAEALESGNFKVFYTDNNGREGLFINLQAISIKLFGAEPWALRVVSAIFGTLAVLGLYFLTKELFASNPKSETSYTAEPSGFRRNPKQIQNSNGQSEFIALLSSFFLATSYWHINFSRIGFRAITVPFFAVFGTYWLLKALRTGKVSGAVMAGIFIGLGFHTYIAFRFMPLVLMAPIILSLLQWRKSRLAASSVSIDYPIGTAGRNCAPCVIAIFLLVTLIVALPIGLYFLQHPADFFGRGGQISIVSAESPLKEFIKSAALTLGMFNVWGDCNPRHNLNCQPELFWPVGLFFIIGLIITARNIFKRPLAPVPYILAAWFIFMMLPAALTREGLPHALRSIGLIPPVMIFAGLGAAGFFIYIENYFESFVENPVWSKSRSQLRRLKKETAALLLAALLAVAANAYLKYFRDFYSSPETGQAFRSELTAMARYADQRAPDARVYFIANYPNLYYGLPIETQVPQFITRTRTPESQRAKNISYLLPESIGSLLPLNEQDGRIIVIPLRQDDPNIFKYVKSRLPSLSLKTRENFLTLEN